MKTKFNFLKKKEIKKSENDVVYTTLIDIREAYQECFPVSQEKIKTGLSDVSDFKFKSEEFSVSHKKGDDFARVAFRIPLYNLKYKITIEDVVINDDRTMLEFKAVGTFLKSITVRVSSKDLDDENVEVTTNILGLEFNKSVVGRLATKLLNMENLVESFTSGDDALFDQVEAY